MKFIKRIFSRLRPFYEAIHILFIARLVIICVGILSISSCITGIWTGASLFYDRHNVYHTLSDYELKVTANNVLFYKNSLFECNSCYIEAAVFNGDILLVGYLPTQSLCQEAYRRVKAIEGYRRVINHLSTQSTVVDPVQDSWITTKIRSQIVADSDIDPQKFKVITLGDVVYIMGDVIPSQAEKVVDIAKNTEGVRQVVKVLKYYHLSDK